MNANQDLFASIYLSNYILIGLIDEYDKKYKLYTHDSNAQSVKKGLNAINLKAQIEPEPAAYILTIILHSFVIEN
jgi:hypothetical protein